MMHLIPLPAPGTAPSGGTASPPPLEGKGFRAANEVNVARSRAVNGMTPYHRLRTW
jgi:hypothetical protein